MKNVDVIGLGISTIDILTSVPYLPGSNQVYEIKAIDIQGGGPVATALVALGRLGASTAYLGTIAEDDWGSRIVEEFKKYGVDPSPSACAATASSAVSVILVEPDGSRAILYEKGTMPELQEQDIQAEVIAAARILHLDGSHPDGAMEAARLAKAHGTLVSLDGGAGEGIWPRMDEMISVSDILIVARDFAAAHTGTNDPLQAGPALLERGAKFVVITDGENGCWYWDESQHIHQPAFKVTVRDTTGAGDTFHGAYLYAYLKQWSPAFSLAFASAVAAIKCTQPGGRKGIPELEQTFSFLQSNHIPLPNGVNFND